MVLFKWIVFLYRTRVNHLIPSGLLRVKDKRRHETSSCWVFGEDEWKLVRERKSIGIGIDNNLS